MSEGIPPREQHPISDEALQQAYDQNDGDDYNPSIDRFHKLLMAVQHTIEADYLSGLLQDLAGSATSEIIREDDAGWTFVDYERNTWYDILSEIGAQRTVLGTIVRDAHAIEAKRIGDEPDGPLVDPEKLPEAHPDNPEILVVGKSGIWRDAEQHAKQMVVNQLLNYVKQGCERHQALDYYITEQQDVRDITQTEWSRMARVEQPSISESVNKARRAINTPPELTPNQKEIVENLTDGEVTFDE